MITYKDQAWCTRNCKNHKCHRNYDPEERANNLAGVNLPLSMMDLKTDDCGFEAMEDKELP